VNNGTPMAAGVTNLAMEARLAGYDPVLFGYTDTTVDPRVVSDPHDPRLRTYEGVLDGFRPVLYLPTDLAMWGEWLRGKGYQVGAEVLGAMYRQRSDVDGIDTHGSTWAPAVYSAEHSEAAFLTERLCDHIQRQSGPWFIHATYIRPHPPYMAPAPFHDMYDAGDVAPPNRCERVEDEGAMHPFLAAALAMDIVTAPQDDREMRQLQATYFGMVSEVDAQLGRLFDHLDRLGVAENTMVVLTSDHGEQLGDHWLLEKLGFFDESYHVPLVIRWPAVIDEPGRVVTEFTEHVDLMPTMLEAIGQPVPLICDGSSLGPFIDDVAPLRWRDAAHWEWDFRDPTSTAIEESFGLRMAECTLTVLRDRHGKYVHFAAMPPLYFDLERDPGETADRAADSAYLPAVLDYAQRMLSWRMVTDDQELTGHLATPLGMISRRD
jgi:arylsulfatase A-like enzyme